MKRSLLIVLAVCALIYLPGLGTLEIKGEEGRRILPAVTMLQTGNYLVPQVGSDAYFNKPPLVNWLVAGSFQLFGKRDEWTARFPSTLCVLLVALAFIVVARRSLGTVGSLAAALIWLTTFGMLEKGRLIEIEALYVSLTGLAFICWLSWWREGRSRWLTWTVPFVFLGLGLLAKGPVLLVFFYAIVLAILWHSGQSRALWNPAHAVGVFIMLGIFAAWAVPCLFAMAGQGDVAHVWSRQFSGRLSGEDFKFAGWIMNIPRGLGYFMPWTILLFAFPFLKDRPRTLDPVQRGLAWGIALSFVFISVLPGSLARYTMPLLAPAAWLVAAILADLKSPAWLRAPRLPLVVAALCCLAIALYAFVAMPKLRKREKVRNIAAQLNAALPPNETLFALDPDYQPALFYVRSPIVYLERVPDATDAIHFLLVQPKDEATALHAPQWALRQPQVVLRLRDYRQKEIVLLAIDGTR